MLSFPGGAHWPVQVFFKLPEGSEVNAFGCHFSVTIGSFLGFGGVKGRSAVSGPGNVAMAHSSDTRKAQDSSIHTDDRGVIDLTALYKVLYHHADDAFIDSVCMVQAHFRKV